VNGSPCKQGETEEVTMSETKSKRTRKARAPKAPGSGKRSPRLSDELVLTVPEAPPPGSGPAMRKRHAKYKDGMTVADAVGKLGFSRRAVRFDIDRGVVKAKKSAA
jgi:hypothetical protein